MFDTTKEDLKDLIRQIHEGKLQLPDFQRDYVWGDEDVRSLIASIAKGFPIGALLTLETGGEVRFKPRLLAGVPEMNVQPAELLLDGQQRMTSLYQSMFCEKPVRTRTPRNTEVDHFYYLDIKRAVGGNAEFEDAIVALPADRVERTDFGRRVVRDVSTRDAEFEQDLFPLNRVFDSRDWFYGYRDFWKARGRDVSDLDRYFVKGTLERIERYKMPLIRLDRANTREAICLVFERVNVGGKKLDAFELVTAIYASDKYDLREDWNGDGKGVNAGRRARIVGSPHPRDVLTKVANTEFLQACSLLHTHEVRGEREASGAVGKELPQVSCKREAVLALPLPAFKKHAEFVEEGFIEAGAFLNELKIIWHKDVPYPPQIVGLASVFASLGRRAASAAAKEKLAQWFWSVTLGELYGSSTESRLARDVPELIEWIQGTGGPPRSVGEALFQANRLRSLRSRISAAYKGIHALLMRRGCLDFVTGRATEIMTFSNDKIDIHHIFPQKWCKDQGIPPSRYDSIVNKTALSKRSNDEIGGRAPSKYLVRIEEKNGIAPPKLDDLLRTHLIDPALLRKDDFDAFFEARLRALSDLVEEAMKKTVVQGVGMNEPETELDDEALEDELGDVA